ncbi:hypothetical protein SERLA73DRAFT_70088 [Serpula lacrymans var. lacrymans S7.3]|uniref:DUF6589 domain-containing protein n=2 Tax=Serpula lacrymans var. lacrymans TaxID=341189 RepID=F8PLV2_SERL3|nr:uncharacterized protein SERLADRAFT_434201 [Serpula lacrymans var. lacrymans S7.9]EGO02584.1 hypothetical protein SERLA73DRAFT_70088 [Serpula lacrymans var. lacrymans S7.3]EGO28301.1 hypothetical protein SERLADRAFT_434201 [Serpula lacrymans var. lacrymans S7.9]
MLEPILVVTTPIVAMKAMDVNNSTVSGNIFAVVELMSQGGFDESGSIENEDLDLSPYIVLFHGDLGTGERLQAVQQRCAIEQTPWDWFQRIIYVPGLFHLKMACADVIWRVFISPVAARDDDTCLMRDIASPEKLASMHQSLAFNKYTS